MQTEIRTHPSGARKLDVAVVAVATLVGALLMPTAAHASEQQAPTIGVVDALTLRNATRTGAEVTSAQSQLKVGTKTNTKSAKALSRLSSKVNAHLDKLARTGNLADSAEVQVATVPDPVNAGAQVQLIWDEGKVPQKVYTASVAGKFAGFGGVFSDADGTDGTVTTANKAAAPVGSGYEGVSDKKNMYKFKGGSIEQWWEPAAPSGPDHYLWSGWEKWAESGTDHWIYNRWARFSRASQNSGMTPETREFTIRSRPVNYETNTDVKSLDKASPVQSVTTCADIANVEFGYERTGISGKVTIPFHRCSDTHPVGTMGRKEIGVKFLGSTRDIVRYLDAAGDYTAKNKTVVPYWADYSWVTVAELTAPGGVPILLEEDYLRKDSSW